MISSILHSFKTIYQIIACLNYCCNDSPNFWKCFEWYIWIGRFENKIRHRRKIDYSSISNQNANRILESFKKQTKIYNNSKWELEYSIKLCLVMTFCVHHLARFKFSIDYRFEFSSTSKRISFCELHGTYIIRNIKSQHHNRICTTHRHIQQMATWW